MTGPLKQFIVCGWNQFYPVGGLGNVQASFDNFAEACTHADSILETNAYADDGKFELVAVYDSKSKNPLAPCYVPLTEDE